VRTAVGVGCGELCDHLVRPLSDGRDRADTVSRSRRPFVAERTSEEPEPVRQKLRRLLLRGGYVVEVRDALDSGVPRRRIAL
jgi:hypothetical protein